MYYDSRFISKINDEHYIVLSEGGMNDGAFYIARYDELKTEFNDIYIPSNNEHIYKDKKCIYFAEWLYIINTQSAKIEKYIYNIDKLFFLTDCIVCVIKKRNRYDEFIKVNMTDLSVETIGNLIFRNMIR